MHQSQLLRHSPSLLFVEIALPMAALLCKALLGPFPERWKPPLLVDPGLSHLCLCHREIIRSGNGCYRALYDKASSSVCVRIVFPKRGLTVLRIVNLWSPFGIIRSSPWPEPGNADEMTALSMSK